MTLFTVPPLREAASLGPWETRVQVTFIEPPRPVDSGLAIEGEKPSALPRRNVVISRIRREASVAEADNAARRFVEDVALGVPGLEIVEQIRPATFQDCRLGARVTVAFSPVPGVLLRQIHFFRLDDEVLTQLTLTFAEADAADPQTEEMEQIVLAWSPDQNMR